LAATPAARLTQINTTVATRATSRIERCLDIVTCPMNDGVETGVARR
jgi:hypothetical protein